MVKLRDYALGQRNPLIEAARIMVGDAEEDARPYDEEEERVMEEFRRELPRPTSAEIEELAVRLARRARMQRLSE